MPMARAVNVRLPEVLYQRLQTKAAADGRTTSNLVRYLLGQAMTTTKGVNQEKTKSEQPQKQSS